MAESASRRKVGFRTKMKTGCTTCRIRKIKCDENKPSCKKCISTGRTCDGYESPFRIVNTQTLKSIRVASSKSDSPLQVNPTSNIEIGPLNTELLSHYFSTKTMFDVKLGCDEEAKQVLEASMTDPPIRHAVLSLRALREDLETSGDGPASVVHPTSNHHYGLQQYNIALGGLASRLNAPSANALKSALICCQVFISIEQVRKNFAAMAQHIIRGLGIIHEYGARPRLDAGNDLLPAHGAQLPSLDVFIIKLFAAPCKFADRPSVAARSTISSSVSSKLSNEELVQACPFRALAPDMRTKLTKIAESTLEFLEKVSQLESVDIAVCLVSEKAALLNSLKSWLMDLELVHTDPEPISTSFLRKFQIILKIVLLGTLDSSPHLQQELKTENDRLQNLANDLGERLKSYVTCIGREERSTVPCRAE